MILRKAIAALLFLASTGAALPADLTGQASIIDGDTLEIHSTRIRLWGIDAPESTQLCRGEDSVQYRCGAKSANDLDAFIAGQPVNCVPIALDRYGRTVATCSIAGADLGECLVRSGLAFDWPQYSKRSTTLPSAMQSTPGAVCGRAAMLSRGYIVLALGKEAGPPTVRTMLVLIPSRSALRI